MVNARELRIGNYFCVAEDGIPDVGVPEYVEVVKNIMTGDERFVDCVNFDRLTYKCRDCHYIYGIHLTEEWLTKKFGFVKSGDYFEITENVKLTSYFEPIEKSSLYSIGYTIQYVHQLQNLYFALTGEELTIK